MNRGEWGEPYLILRLLGYKKLVMADENGNPNPKEWMEVLKIVRYEPKDRVVTYHRNEVSDDIEIEINSVYVTSVRTEEFRHMADLLRADIAGAAGRSFNVSEKVVKFLREVEIKHMKAKSVEKSDIFLDTRDPRSSIVRENIGFSVKSEFGEKATLFNTARASAVKYKIGGMSVKLMNEINSMVDSNGHAAVSDRCRAIRDNGCSLDYVGYENAVRAKCEAFRENLELINPYLPAVIQRILWNHFMEKQNDVDIDLVTQRIVNENPCEISRPEIRYPYMMKMFLYSAYCGMTASTVWDGKSTVKGGYITVKETGDVVANYALESEEFKSFLFKHCYLDFPSTDQGHGAYGEVYAENGDFYFKLNFQIRIK